MWFRRPPRNRRRKNGEVLDVKLRADQVRAGRTRFAATAITVGLGTAFGLYVLWRLGDWGLDKLVYENPSFAISQVDIRTDGSIPQAELHRWCGVNPGANLISLDLANVKRNLELVSTIDTVSIERILPRTLKIMVTERHPVAQTGIPRTLPSGDVVLSQFQLDERGHVMQSLARVNSQLPTVTGLNYRELLPGYPIISTQGLAALRFIGAFNHSPMSGKVGLQSVDVSTEGVLQVSTTDGGEVTFALDRVDQQLRRWREVYDWGKSAGKTIAAMDLAVGNNVPVKWNFAGNGPAPVPSEKHLHSRRKNV